MKAPTGRPLPRLSSSSRRSGRKLALYRRSIVRRYGKSSERASTTSSSVVRRKEHASQARKSLAIKREILKELTAINEGEEPENLRELLAEYNERWKQAGSVPHKEKEAINAAYRELLDALHGKLRKHRSERRLSGYGASLDNLENKGSNLQTEHSRLQRHLDRQRAELNTYENNLTFLNVSSKSGSTLLNEIERKRDALIADIELTEKKLRLLEQKERETEQEGE